MATNLAIAHAFGASVGMYIQPGGAGDWYDHNGNPAIPVAGPHGVCIFTWVNSPPGALQPREWKVEYHCTGGHNCSPPVGTGSKAVIPLGTKIQTNCP